MPNHYSRYILLLFGIAVSGLILFLSGPMDIMVHVTALGLLALFACAIVRFDPLHPYCWFSASFFIYYSAYAIYYNYGDLAAVFGWRLYFYDKEALVYSWIALAVFLLVMSPKEAARPSTDILYSACNGLRVKFLNPVVAILGIWFLSMAGYYILSGMTHKNQFYALGLVGQITATLAVVSTIIFAYMFYVKSAKKGKLALECIPFAAGPLAVLGLIIAQRDWFIRFIVLSVFIGYALGRIKKKHFIAIIPLGMTLLVFYGFERDISSLGEFILSFMSSEFIAAGSNLQILITNETGGLFGGRGFLYEFARTFYIPIHGPTHMLWYHDTFFFHSDTGMGFTLVGSGYVELGVLGIIIVFIFVAAVLRFLYFRMYKTPYMFIAYIFIIPAYIYMLRMSLFSALSSLIKHAVLTLGLIYICDKLLSKVNFPGASSTLSAKRWK